MRFALLAVSAVALSGFAVQPADAARVCRSVCSHGVCTKNCTSDRSDVVIRHRDRGVVVGRGYRDREVIERRHQPGVEVDTPIGGVRVR